MAGTAMGWTCVTVLVLLSVRASAQARAPKTCKAADEAALLDFRRDFTCSDDIDPGVTCPLDSWTSDSDCCTDWEGISCDSRGRVKKIKVTSFFRPPSSFGIRGNERRPFGRPLAELKELQDIEMRFVQMSQPLPKAFANITKLRRLSLIACNIIGEIPGEYGRLSNLETLRVDTVSPDYFGQGMVGTTGIPQELCSLHKLKHLFLFYNPQLSGSIPSCIDRWTSIESISIFNTMPGFTGVGGLTGKLPATIGKLSTLKKLRLSWNNLRGELPKSITNLRHLRVLELDHNQFTGSIPPQIAYMKSLEALNLHSNRLYGKIPHSIAALSNLIGLDLGNNSFWGEIPSVIYNMPRLGSLILNNNRIWGRFPQYWGPDDAMKFFQIDVSHNYLSGPLPSKLKHNTFFFDASFNSLSGSLPASIGELTFLRELDLSYCKFTGRIPADIANAPALTRLDLSFNKLSGPVPEALRRIPELYLAFDNVTGYR
ncbi:hypothetical protein MPTK1_2g10030 [Marchantia polymorpha subsp. ruderalis]|nr:hypothetical protein MARPO_0129s0028 [Marchantia polymorpha]BBN01756.1 hypothetical protein Mp_2g10030 [Marchantia polymorpha subsp. ruderalis]|eukprot:PTQ30139.1 hypothetical protein MARPO_0129s0028 [Marchantia polymorpha]